MGEIGTGKKELNGTKIIEWEKKEWRKRDEKK